MTQREEVVITDQDVRGDALNDLAQGNLFVFVTARPDGSDGVALKLETNVDSNDELYDILKFALMTLPGVDS